MPTTANRLSGLKNSWGSDLIAELAGMQGRLLISAGESPGRLAPAFLSENKPHLLRWAQTVGMIGAKSGTGLSEAERAEHVVFEETVGAAYFAPLPLFSPSRQMIPFDSSTATDKES